MGIENFHTWLKKTYPGSFMPIRFHVKYDNIYIDINHILHHSIRGVRNKKEFVDKFYNALDIIFNNFFATKKIVLAVDGTSPYSKVILQRKRRLQSVKNLNLNKLNSLELTPGTDLMRTVDFCLKDYANRLTNNYHILKPQIIVLTANYPDEGEIKIFKYIRENMSNLNESHLVVGNDADLVVLAMSSKPIYNINMLIRYMDSLELVSIKKLIDDYTSLMNLNFNQISNKNSIYNSDIRSDFVIVSIMYGNDYIPKLRYVKLEMLWDAYKETVSSISNNTCEILINIPNIQKKSDSNNTLIKDLNFNKSFLINFMINIIRRLSPSYRKPNLNDYNEKNVVNYLEGLLWCLHMYQTGVCSMYNYIYNGEQSPSPNEILYYLLFNTNVTINVPKSNVPPLSASYYSLLLMPYNAKQLVPKQYHFLMDDKLKYIYDKELCKECNDYKSRLSVEHKKLKKTPDDELIKENIGFISKKLSDHTKASHGRDFNIDDINNIINTVKKYVKKN